MFYKKFSSGFGFFFANIGEVVSFRFSETCREVEYNIQDANKRTYYPDIDKVHETCVWFQLFSHINLRRTGAEASD